MSGITLSKQQEVTYTQKEDGYVISGRDWKRLKKKISNLQIPSKRWSNIAWGSLGTGLSCMGSWIAEKENTSLLIVGAVGITSAIISFCAAQSEKKQHSEHVVDIKEVVLEIEEVIIPQGENR